MNIPRMSYPQYRKARRLTHECCNYCNGNCLLLDDGEECVCVQSISYSLLCRLILPIFKEINYLSHDQFREMNERLKRFEEQPEIVRKKIKGDYLVDHEKYINAIQVYQETLKDTEENETNMGSQFTGSIYNNMGCAYASLFQMNEALTCFQKANEELHTKASLKSWLFAVYMSKGQDAYEQMCTERKVDAETKREMDRQITEAMQVELPRDLDEALAAWTREYHKNTGL